MAVLYWLDGQGREHAQPGTGGLGRGLVRPSVLARSTAAESPEVAQLCRAHAVLWMERPVEKEGSTSAPVWGP